VNVDILCRELSGDEGCRYSIYLDHLGLPTFGIGHLIRSSDPEYNQPVGTEVPKKRVRDVFMLDVAVTRIDCLRLYPNFDALPEECQLIIANMMFNMGRKRLSKFKKMRAAVNRRDWGAAADEMVDSRWYTQVPNRAKRLVKRMRDLAESTD
jgi:lysozyme